MPEQRVEIKSIPTKPVLETKEICINYESLSVHTDVDRTVHKTSYGLLVHMKNGEIIVYTRSNGVSAVEFSSYTTGRTKICVYINIPGVGLTEFDRESNTEIIE